MSFLVVVNLDESDHFILGRDFIKSSNPQFRKEVPNKTSELDPDTRAKKLPFSRIEGLS